MNASFSTHQSSQPVFSAQRIAELVAPSPDQAILPTPEQTAIIEQPLGTQVLVIAGAGSGKTETMANRVVWLVANGFAAPDQVLGLTFTRKAAGELSDRISSRLQHFVTRLSDPRVQVQLNPVEKTRALELQSFLSEGLDVPEVSTYNAFASAVVQEFGALAGLASGAAVIDKSTAWAIAREIVCTSNEPELVQADVSISTLVKRVIRLDNAVAENLTTFEAVRASLRPALDLSKLPYNDKKAEGRYAGITAVCDAMHGTELIAKLATAYAAEKRRRGLIEFSDQLALAVHTLQTSPEAVRQLRNRTPIVLLDEVQDTSVAQTRVLSMLFAGASVMAVGDPHQSIYGFRGASASNLRSFHSDFADPRHADHSRKEPIRAARDGALTLGLSTSWRNPTQVLQSANVLSAPLVRQLAEFAPDIGVTPLSSRAQYLQQTENDATPRVEAHLHETLAEEFEALAHWMRDARNEHLSRTGAPPTAAVLFRNRKHMSTISRALWQVGVPNRIVGLGGLLTTPEVTDIVSTLRCLWFADADSELIRLLSGPRFRVGVADLQGLKRAARWFAERDFRQQKVAPDETVNTQLIDMDHQFTLVDALDEIAALRDLDHSSLHAITPLGRERLHEAGQMLRELRQQVGSDVLALIHSVTLALRIDIELDAAEHTGYDGSALARANIDAFQSLVEAFLSIDDQGTLHSVLSWLEQASEDDEPAEHVPEPEPGTVQLITVHGAKGLEWDLVAIPRLVTDEFPGKSRDGLGWLRPGELPDELRGDAAARPQLDLSTASTQQEALERIEHYKAELSKRHALEERRLAYVAVTRSASRLLLTASFWGGQKTPRASSPFLQELEAADLIAPLQASSAFSEDPSSTAGRSLEWPLDPLGHRATRVLTAAELLRAALQQPDLDPNPVVELLLAEQAASRKTEIAESSAPERLTASTLHEFIEHPQEYEMRRLRPLPMRPYRRTLVGNLFHKWVEHRSSTVAGTSLTLPGFDTGELLGDWHDTKEKWHEDLDELIEKFEKSRWADKQPIAVELELTLPFADRSLVCKIDAVYRHLEGELTRYEVVDWKSGAPPQSESERKSRFVQLNLYRHAYAIWAGVAPEHIDVTLFYVADEIELRAEELLTLQQLETLWREAAESLTNGVI